MVRGAPASLKYFLLTLIPKLNPSVGAAFAQLDTLNAMTLIGS